MWGEMEPFTSGTTLVQKTHSSPQKILQYVASESLVSLGILRSQLRAPLNSSDITEILYPRSLRAMLNWAPIMPNKASQVLGMTRNVVLNKDIPNVQCENGHLGGMCPS